MAARKAVPKKAVPKKKDSEIQVPIATRAQDRLHQSKVPFGDLRNIIADTLERCFVYGQEQNLRVSLYEGRHARVNAEAQAEIIARSIMYEDSGFRIRDEDIEIPYCRECDE